MPRPRKQHLTETSKLPTLPELIEEDRKQRLAVAQEYHEANYGAKVHYDTSQNPPTVCGLGTVYDRLRYMQDHLCSRFPESVRYKIHQMIRQRNLEGKETLYIQLIRTCKDYAGNPIEMGMNIGKIEKPRWIVRWEGFDPQTGEAVSQGKESVGFDVQFPIPFSEALVRSLELYFGSVSFVLNSGTRRYSVDYEGFIKPFETLKAELEPQKKTKKAN